MFLLDASCDFFFSSLSFFSDQLPFYCFHTLLYSLARIHSLTHTHLPNYSSDLQNHFAWNPSHQSFPSFLSRRGLLRLGRRVSDEAIEQQSRRARSLPFSYPHNRRKEKDASRGVCDFGSVPRRRNEALLDAARVDFRHQCQVTSFILP